MKQDNLRNISAKDLGKLNMPDFCPRCFWLERHLGKSPSIFPGIFSALDAITKRSAHRSFSERGRAPGWLSFFDNLSDVEEGDTYFKLPVAHGWVLTGAPDDIFLLKDGDYHIVDYKTAKFTEKQDELFPLYEIQLNCYAFLAEKYGYKPIKRLSLVYCQPEKDLNNDETFELSFQPYYVDVDLKPEKVSEMLLKARETVDLEEPPPARESCKGICQWVEKAMKKISENN